MLKVTVKTEVRATEDMEKIKIAIKNVFSPSKIELLSFNEKLKVLVASSTSYESLEKLRELLRRERILDAAHRILKMGISENRLVFRLNKQAAYAGHLSFSDVNESPLGPITFEIECKDPRGLIDWLAPRTFGGIVREYGRPEC